MSEPPGSLGHLAATTKQIGRQLRNLGSNRFNLLLLELKEERPRMFQAFLLALGAGLCLLLAVLCLTVLIVVLCWSISPAFVLVALTGTYLAGGIYLCRKLIALLEGWQAFPVSREQFAEDSDSLSALMK